VISTLRHPKDFVPCSLSLSQKKSFRGIPAAPRVACVFTFSRNGWLWGATGLTDIWGSRRSCFARRAFGLQGIPNGSPARKKAAVCCHWLLITDEWDYILWVYHVSDVIAHYRGSFECHVRGGVSPLLAASLSTTTSRLRYISTRSGHLVSSVPEQFNF
jgi:hypothetical protein